MRARIIQRVERNSNIHWHEGQIFLSLWELSRESEEYNRDQGGETFLFRSRTRTHLERHSQMMDRIWDLGTKFPEDIGLSMRDPGKKGT